MGMFDYLFISVDKLPVSEEEKEIIREIKPEWQTKQFSCMLTEIYITDEGELQINTYQTGWDDTKKNGLGTMGVFTRENEKLVVVPYHGWLNFYGYVKNDWYEFDAKFTDGKLEMIDGGKDNSPLNVNK